MIRRFFCEHCCRLHAELPDCIVPHKHYDAEIISGVIDGIVTTDDLDSEDYPCAATMLRWIRWFAKNLANIEGLLRNATAKVKTYKLTSPGKSVLSLFKQGTLHWLEDLMAVIYNNGEKLSAGYG